MLYIDAHPRFSPFVRPQPFSEEIIGLVTQRVLLMNNTRGVAFGFVRLSEEAEKLELDMHGDILFARGMEHDLLRPSKTLRLLGQAELCKFASPLPL